MSQTEISKDSAASLKKGSKSFALATLFFSRELREDVSHLYSWCRRCDDITDGSVLGFGQNSSELPSDRVEVLRKMSLLALQGKEEGLELPFVAFGRVMRKYNIPWIYADDLLTGMLHDAAGRSIETFNDLLLYCYRVAGTVGVMMCYLMGLKNPGALKNAVDLGIALQLTNIARDVGDDYRATRIYLPSEWLKEFGLSPDQLLSPSSSGQLEALVSALLQRADKYYCSGKQGLIELPWRCAVAVSVAASVYRTIGVRVLKLGHQSWQTRVSLGKWDMTLALMKGIGSFLTSVPARILNRRSVVPLDRNWRFS